MFQIGRNKFLIIKKYKNIVTLCRGHVPFVILTEKKFLERYREKIAKNKSKSVQSWKSNQKKRR